MLRFFKSPLVRISFGLMMMTIAMLLIADMLGIVPDTKDAEIQSRKIISESVAVQLSTEISNGKIHGVEEIMRTVVERNVSILSGAIRMQNGELLSVFGDHEKYWTLVPEDNSTVTQVQVPLYNDNERWGGVELRFRPLVDKENWFSLRGSFYTVVLFMALAGFLGYLFFLKRTMRELNPDAVIPERVRKALDTLAEGLLIVDHAGFIVFSNAAFTRKIGLIPTKLIGKKSADLDWEIDADDYGNRDLPWVRVLDGQEIAKAIRIKLKTSLHTIYTFTVNVSPIMTSTNKIRGALITFDDITEIERKNEELQRTLDKLETSQREISRQNQELQVLATRDPLTGALNRRSLFQGFETLFLEAQEEGAEISCIMVDIDHFKSVNDRFGHTVGDKVIKLLAKILTENSRPNDLVGRFGGEEFCIVLPDVGIDIAVDVAEVMRHAIQEGEGGKFTNALRITSSFGVASMSNGISNHAELLERADNALYAAKEGGRNRVIKWSNIMQEGTQNVAPECSLDNKTADERIPSGKQQNTLGNASNVIKSDLEQSHEHDVTVANTFQQSISANKTSEDDKNNLLGNYWSSEDICQSNSMLLIDRLDQAIKRAQRYSMQIAIMVIDVDALQRVSDTLGLAVTEKLSKSIIGRIKRVLRRTDTVALTEQDELLFSVSLLGRSEIVVLLTDLKQGEIVTSILQRIISMNQEPIEVEGNEYYLNSNVGISLFPADGEKPDSLIRNASSAMQEAKQQAGRNNFRFYSEDINQHSKRRIRWEAELHRAMKREEFIVYYQPKIDLNSGTILGMEALLRWQHPHLGLVPPNDFIPLAEQTGLIEEISQWVFHTVCRQIIFWQEAGYGTIKIAINLSPVEFRNSELGNQIINLVHDYGVTANAIELEITETVVMQNMDTAVAILEMLSDAGFGISVDDFGTGYSSLSYLKRFPLSKVKIDRTFISDFTKGANDAAIVSAIIAMSHSLGLRVVAEGVETEEQLRFLQDLHCDEIQGYLISKPVPREEASDLLAQSSSIQRMIMDYGIQYKKLVTDQGVGPTTGMIGILNDYQENSLESSIF